MNTKQFTRLGALGAAVLMTSSALVGMTATTASAANTTPVAEQSPPTGYDGSRITVRNLTGKAFPVASSWSDYNSGKTVVLQPGGSNVHIDQGYNKGEGLFVEIPEGSPVYAQWSTSGIDSLVVLGKGRYISAHNSFDAQAYVVGGQFSQTDRAPSGAAKHWTMTNSEQTEQQDVTGDFKYKVTYRNSHDGYKCWDIDITTLN